MKLYVFHMHNVMHNYFLMPRNSSFIVLSNDVKIITVLLQAFQQHGPWGVRRSNTEAALGYKNSVACQPIFEHAIKTFSKW